MMHLLTFMVVTLDTSHAFRSDVKYEAPLNIPANGKMTSRVRCRCWVVSLA